MPWRIEKQGEKHCVVKESDGSTVACHDTRGDAKKHLAALYVNEPSAQKASLDKNLWEELMEDTLLAAVCKCGCHNGTEYHCAPCSCQWNDGD